MKEDDVVRATPKEPMTAAQAMKSASDRFHEDICRMEEIRKIVLAHPEWIEQEPILNKLTKRAA